MSTRFLILVRAADRDTANAAAKQHFDRTGGQFTFTVPLFAADAPDDSTPVYYVCSADVTAANVPLLRQMQAQFTDSALLEYSLTEQPSFYADTLASRGLRTARPNLT